MEVEVTEPGFDSLRTDSECRVRNQSLIGEYYVDCEVGTAKQELPDGGTVPVERTSSSIPPDLIASVMRRPYRERFRLLLSELGVGLAGRPEELNEVIRRAHPALKEVNETLAILDRQNETIRDFITDADTVSAAVEPKKRAAVALGAGGDGDGRDPGLARRPAPGPVEQAAEVPRRAAADARTARRDGQRADSVPAPDARGGAGLLPPAEGARAVLQRVTRLHSRARRGGRRRAEGAVGIHGGDRRAARALRGRAAARQATRQFLQTIDDRERSVEDDPLHQQLAPPAPDKTAAQEGEGFTGMEALLNYVYWQTLGVNGFDQVSHFLRIVVLRNDCSGVPERAHRGTDRALLDRSRPVPAVHQGPGPRQGRGPGQLDPQRQGPLHARGARG